jgi:hypothetical protein
VDVAVSDAVLDDKPTERAAPDGQQRASYPQGKLVEAEIVKQHWAAILAVLKER